MRFCCAAASVWGCQPRSFFHVPLLFILCHRQRRKCRTGVMNMRSRGSFFFLALWALHQQQSIYLSAREASRPQLAPSQRRFEDSIRDLGEVGIFIISAMNFTTAFISTKLVCCLLLFISCESKVTNGCQWMSRFWMSMDVSVLIGNKNFIILKSLLFNPSQIL